MKIIANLNQNFRIWLYTVCITVTTLSVLADSLQSQPELKHPEPQLQLKSQLNLQLQSDLELRSQIDPQLMLQTEPQSHPQPLQPQCPVDSLQCSFKDKFRNEYFFVVNEMQMVVQYLEGKHLEMKCPPGVSLDDKALPRFESEAPVELVRVVGCGSGVPYAQALRELRITPTQSLVLVQLPLPIAPLGELPPSLRKLELAGPELESEGALREAVAPLDSPLPALLALHVSRMAVSEGALLRLPTTLRNLHLGDASLENVTSATWQAALSRLNALQGLELAASGSVSLPASLGAGEGGALTAAWLDAPLAEFPAPRQLRELTLWHLQPGAAASTRAAWRPCSLLTLNIAYWRDAQITAGWLDACTELERVELKYVEVSALPERLLASPALTELTVSRCHRLQRLPTDLLYTAPRLRLLDLSHNALTHLPEGLFAPLVALEKLDLSHNAFTLAGVAGALHSLPAASLHTLALQANPLGPLCAGGAGGDSGHGVEVASGVSPLAHLVQLQTLELANTNVTAVCRDWRDGLLALTHLDLSTNRIRSLQFRDLQFVRFNRSEVDLRDNPIEAVTYSREEYRALLGAAGDSATAQGAAATAVVLVHMDTVLKCDCHAYWAALAARPPASQRALAGVRCAGSGEALERAAPESMVCAVPNAQCAHAAGCACAARPAGDRDVVQAHCEHAGLQHVPRVPAAERDALLELRLAHNDIRDLRSALLPDYLTVLDLHNNSISEVSEETAAALVRGDERRLLLADNPLQCRCADRALLQALQAHQNKVLDYAEVRCADGRPLHAVVADELCARAQWSRVALAGACGVLALAAAAALLVRSRLRGAAERWLKEALLSRGLCVAWALRPPGGEGWGGERDEEDADKQYDAFVSFAHGPDEDAVWVSEQLVPVLERSGYRVCVHYRDWTPGELITSQIDRSVLSARRTLAVLSDSFAASVWARAEFRAARALSVRDGRARLVALVPDTGVPLKLHEELRAHIESNTYLRRDDPWFWQKLCAALGAPLSLRAPHRFPRTLDPSALVPK